MRSAAKSLGGWADELDPPKVDPNFESVTLRAIFDDIGVTRSPLVDQDADDRPWRVGLHPIPMAVP